MYFVMMVFHMVILLLISVIFLAILFGCAPIIDSKVVLDSVNYANRIATFGYFKNKEDAERAIELFGDEIKELFVEVE